MAAVLIISSASAAALNPAATAAASVASSAAGRVQTTAIPEAGSVTASPLTDVILRGVGSADLVVVGSVSGKHAGSTVQQVDGKGVEFHPTAQFAAGETITVSTDVVVTGAVDGHYSFRIGTPAKHPAMLANGDIATPAAAAAAKAAAATEANSTPETSTPAAARTAEPLADGPALISRPDLRPPTVTVNQPANGATAPGLILATPIGRANSQPGTMIYDDTGKLLWFKPAPANVTVGNLQAITFHGQPALTWFEGVAPYVAGSYRGEWVVVDRSYRELTRLRMANGYQADLHDIKFTDHDTAYLEGYNPLRCDNVTIKPCKTGATVLEDVIQEIDLDTGTVLFEWHSLDHIPLTDSYISNQAAIFDYIHTNSLDIDHDGNLLMSSRHTSALFKINSVTGALIWTIGGKDSTFSFVGDKYQAPCHVGPDFPHDFRVRTDGSYSYHDNGVLRAEGYSAVVNKKCARVSDTRGAVIKLDLAAKTATYVKQLERQPAIYGATQGRVQEQTNGDTLVTWGGLGPVTEFNGADQPVFDATLSAGSYRQVRELWTGVPAELPALVVNAAGGVTKASVSWNGDTRTSSWRLLAGSSQTTLKPVKTTSSTAFETAFSVTGVGPYFAVEALDVSGKTLVRSTVVRSGPWFLEKAGPIINGAYQPLVGDFGGSRNDDVLYYAAGTAPESLQISDGTGSFSTVPMPAVNGHYRPIVGDFVGDDRSEVLWWSPTSTVAYMWRFDRGSRTTLAIQPQSSKVSVLSGSTTQPVLLANRPSYGGGKDEVLWYGKGAAPDRVDRYDWNAGQLLSVHSRPISIAGTYQPVSGDFDGNGQGDVLWYAAGAAPDYLWLTDGGSSGSTGQRTVPVAINGKYQPVVGNFAGSARSQDIFFWAAGSAPDFLWTFNPTGSHLASDATSVHGGQMYSLRSGTDYAMAWSGVSPLIWQQTAAGPLYTASENSPVGANYVPLVGDFVGAGGIDSVLWYAVGPAPEKLYVGR
ncbi:MAG: arylsulfotransferase family protein [Nakamurella sp.]